MQGGLEPRHARCAWEIRRTQGRNGPCPACAGETYELSPAEKLCAEAWRLRRERSFGESLAAADAALEADPDHAHTHMALAALSPSPDSAQEVAALIRNQES